jgi:hypothetical protein
VLNYHVLKHGRTEFSGPAQTQWYSAVRQWLERNRLTGGIDSYWGWSLPDCQKLNRLYEILIRRERGVQTAPVADINDDVKKINSLLAEMRDLAEEVGPIAELVFCTRYRRALFWQHALCFAAVLIVPIALFDPGLHNLCKPVQMPADRRLIADRLVESNVGAPNLESHRSADTTDGAKINVETF